MCRYWFYLFVFCLFTADTLECRTVSLCTSDLLLRMHWTKFILLSHSASENITSNFIQNVETNQQNVTSLLVKYTLKEETNTSSLRRDLVNLLQKEFQDKFVVILPFSKFDLKTLFTFLNDFIADLIDIFSRFFTVKTKWIFMYDNGDPCVDLVTYIPMVTSFSNIITITRIEPCLVKAWLGQWTLLDLNSVHDVTENVVFPNIQYKLGGRHLAVGHLTVSAQAKIDYVQFMDVISSYLNFTYTLVTPDDLLFGNLGNNGTWTGLVGQLVRKETDFICARLTKNKERELAIDFIYPSLKTTSIGLMYKKPISQPVSWYLFFMPLHPYVYICVISAYCAVAIILVFTLTPDIKESFFTRLSISLLFTWSCLFLESSSLKLSRLSGRLLVATWWIFCILIATVYTANLTRSLIPKDEDPFKDLKDLLKKPDWSIGVLGGSATFQFIKSSNLSEAQTTYQRFLANPILMSNNFSEHLIRVQNGNYAFLSEMAEDPSAVLTKCLFQFKTRIIVSNIDQSMTVSKNSLLKYYLEELVTKLQYTGIINYILKRQKSECIINEKVKPLGIQNVKGGTILVLVGLGISVCVLVFEIFVKFRQVSR